MPQKTALITGVTGQDGAYLAELLLQKGYRVHGLSRHVAGTPVERMAAPLRGGAANAGDFALHGGDLGDGPSLIRLLQRVQPDEVYHLAAQSHVAVSFGVPEYTFDCNALGTLRLLDAVHSLGLGGHTRFYQASTSELYGAAVDHPQDERTPFQPRSPYAIAKLAAHWTAVNYREAHGLFVCCGILFNHESPRRGESFVSRRITLGLARIVCGLQAELRLGNLDARRDWGHARDYVRAQWLMLQQARPDDYVVATGETRSVREFVAAAARELGLQIDWEGEGAAEIARVVAAPASAPVRPGQVIVRVDPALLRPSDVPALCGDAGKARRVLGWSPTTGFESLVAEMVAADLQRVRAGVACSD